MQPKLASKALFAPVLVLVLAAPLGAQLLEVHYPDIEQGSATLVVAPGGRALLVDAGTALDPTDDDIALFVQDLIATGEIASLDAVVATHYDEDHIGRLEDVLYFGGVAPTVVTWDRGVFHSTPTTFAYADYEAAAEAHGRTTITPFTDIDLGGGVVVECYAVNGDLRDGSTIDVTGSGQFENSASIALVVRYGDFDVWIGGDLTGDPDRGVTDVESGVAPLVGDVDVYTVNHHGSRTSSNATFLATLAPEVAIVQSSVTNSFGHPNSEVVQRILATPDTSGATPLFFQQNPGDPDDTRTDDSLATAIADPDDVTDVLGLPGTITVRSDGASYQIYGGDIPALVLPADSGAGTLGDYPPAVRRVARSPVVPLASEAVTVTAEISDEGAATAEVRWWLDDVEQAPIAMTQGAGTTWSADIPAQPDGAKVVYRVEAEDSVAQVGRSRSDGYYSGVTPISTFRVSDADGVLQTTRLDVRVEADVTAEPGLFHSFVTQAFVQDATGGVQIFDGSLLPLARGDRARFVGEIIQYSGLTEVSTDEAFGNFGHTLVSTGTPPAPLVVTVAQVDESLEGQLIRIDGVEVISGSIPESGNGVLTISDDGGVSTTTLFVDGDTDVPGAATPTQPFDLIGVAAQFDTTFPYDFGYEIIPRERADILSEEVNLPPLLINEIHADPDGTLAGDANGDGVRDAADDEFVELLNTGTTALDISGWSLADGLSVRHTFAAGTVVPPAEAVVVFGGGTPTGEFGNAAANGLVLTASSGSLSLNNGGDTVTLTDGAGLVVQQATYGSEGGNDQSLNRDPDGSNTPFALHSQIAGSGGALHSPGTRVDGQAFTVPAGALILTEVLYDADGADGGLEWIELYNTTADPIDLSGLSLGAGGSDYTSTLAQLSGVVQPGATFVVGGPTSSSANGSPTYDQVLDFSPDLQNSGSDADGVALFNVRASQVTAATVPIDAVVYGPANTNGLIDETGTANPPEVEDAPSGSSIERIDLAGAWQVRSVPDPNAWSAGELPPPPPSGDGLVLSEVFYDADSGDDGFEWVELYNDSADPIDLAAFSLGNGGSDYTYSTVQLSGVIAAGATFVVGGPTSDASNGSPAYDLAVDFSPDFQNSGSIADGVALFNVTADQVTASTVPIDAVVYGDSNSSGLIDESGAASAPEVGDAPAGSSIERVDLAGAWQIQSAPNPGVTAFGGGDTTPPAAPTGLAATAGDGSVSLDWADNGEADLDGYHVHRSTTSGGPYTQLTGAPLATSDYLDSAVTNGTTYHYVVTAVDTAGNESADSAEVSATPQAAGGGPTLHVASIVPSTVGGKNKRGRVEVSIVDDAGQPVGGALVTGTFTGDYSESGSGTTSGAGTAKIDTSGQASDPVSYTFCVDDVSLAGYTYDPAANVETCDSL